MKDRPCIHLGIVALAIGTALGVFTTVTQAEPAKTKLSTVQVDSSWPKPLPRSDHPRTSPAYLGVKSTATGQFKPWVTGDVTGTCIDSQDHVFIVTRGNLVAPEDIQAVPSPPVIEFDAAGSVVNAWGDRNVLPNGVHGCFVDYQGNVWIAGVGDGIVQKYSRNGTLLLQIGTRGVCDNPPTAVCGNSGANPAANQSLTLLNQPADIYIDPNPDPVTGQRGSIYIADGNGNHRVVVFSATGTWLRQWGGVAGVVNNPVTDSPGVFAASDGGHPHCIAIGNDGLVYVCDRGNDRVQVFTKTGQLQRIIPIVPGTGATFGIGGAPGLGTAGSAWDLAFSKDLVQTHMFVADGGNERMYIMDRALGTIVEIWGQPGHQAGQFTFLHSVSIDSKGNVYTGEANNGRRVQKFTRVNCNSGNAQSSCK